MYSLYDLFGRISQRLHLYPQLSLEKLSFDIKVERHTIEKAVKLGAGVTFRNLRKRGMLNAAKKMLVESPHLTLKEVAHAMGYRSLSAFSRFIKAAAGCSPSELRHQITAETLASKKVLARQLSTAISEPGDD